MEAFCFALRIALICVWHCADRALAGASVVKRLVVFHLVACIYELFVNNIDCTVLGDSRGLHSELLRFYLLFVYLFTCLSPSPAWGPRTVCLFCTRLLSDTRHLLLLCRTSIRHLLGPWIARYHLETASVLPAAFISSAKITGQRRRAANKEV